MSARAFAALAAVGLFVIVRAAIAQVAPDASSSSNAKGASEEAIQLGIDTKF